MWSRSNKCKKYCSVIGAHLILAPVSYLWIYGNLSAYIDSYFRFSCSPGCMDGDSRWILGLCLTSVCPGIFLTKNLAVKIGLKFTGILAASIISICLFASVWTVKVSVVGTAIVLGVVLGSMLGVISSVAFQYVSGWAPERSSLFMATTSGASALISVPQNQIITAIVNPNNSKPDAMQGSRTFFSQQEILDKVPTVLIVYAAMTTGFQLVGYLLLASQEKPSSQCESPAAEKEEVHITSTEGSKDNTKTLNSSEIRRFDPSQQDYGSNQVSTQTTTLSSYHDIRVNSKTDTTGDELKSPNASKAEDSPKSLKLVEVMQTPVFYASFMFGIAIAFSFLLKANYYKQFGLLYIRDDKYLTLVGTLIPVISFISRLVIGTALSKHYMTIKDVFVFGASLNSFLCSFWYIVPQVNEVLYLFLVVSLAFSHGLVYMIFPVVALQKFGPAHFSANYGVLQLPISGVGLLFPVIVSTLLHNLGWCWIFGLASVFSLLSLVLTVCVDFDSPIYSL